MKEQDIKFVYEIDSTLDLEDTLNALQKELNPTEGILEYFDISKDTTLQETIPFDKLLEKISTLDEDESIGYRIIFSNVIIVNDGEELTVVSKIKLKLKDVDVAKVIKK